MSCFNGVLAQDAAVTPKYVFMFIGDGQASPQITTAQYYLGTLQNPDATMPTPAQLSYTGFENVGLMTTYDATSFCPDSASTATAMASGKKTLSGVINYNIEKTEPYTVITEYAKAAGKKVGVISSVSLDHATPAAYYAKVPSRGQYYDIAVQGLSGTDIDFFGGGGFLQPTGKEGDQKDLMEIAAENGWNIVNAASDIRALDQSAGRTLAISETLDAANALPYEIDRERRTAAGEDILSLADVVQAGINVLDGDDGFFLMTEGGKIDWTCHANDAATSIHESIAMSDAVQVAIDFAKDHADETLIIVTGDHETGGLTIGYAATAYETHFDYLQNQIISFTDFDTVIKTLRESGATFADALAQIETYYGLTVTADQDLTLTEEELASLESAFTLSMQEKAERTIGTQEQLAYGGYEPLSMAVSHIFNNKAGIAFTSYAHTGIQMPVFATGVNAEGFSGVYDNCDIFSKTMAAMGLTE